MIIEKRKIYKLKDEFFLLLQIPVHQWKERKEDLLEWLNNFFDYEIIEGKPIKIQINEIYEEEYQPLPYKAKWRNYSKKEKVAAYNNFVKENLPEEYKHMSKRRMAKKALLSFGIKDFGHYSSLSVVKTYVGPAMEEFGECDNNFCWCWYKTYEEVKESEIIADWRMILKKHKIDEEEISNAFYLQETVGDSSQMDKVKIYFKEAMSEFIGKYGDYLVRIPSWRKKR